MAVLSRSVIVIALACAFSLILSAQSADTASTVEQRIQRIQDRILSAPFLFGEPDGRNLADRISKPVVFNRSESLGYFHPAIDTVAWPVSVGRIEASDRVTREADLPAVVTNPNAN